MDNLPVKDIEAQAEKAKRTTVKERYQGHKSDPAPKKEKKTDRGDETNIANAYKTPQG